MIQGQRCTRCATVDQTTVMVGQLAVATKDALDEIRVAALRMGVVLPQRLAAAAASGPLTTQERRTLVLMAQGWTDEEIAVELFVSSGTVKTHAKHMYAKLGARNRTHAVHLAWHLGYLKAGPMVAVDEDGCE